MKKSNIVLGLILIIVAGFLRSPTNLFGQTVTVYEETFDSPWNTGDWDQYTPEGGAWATQLAPFICQGDQAVSHWDNAEPVNGWIISDLISLQAGITYTCSFQQRVGNGSFPENMGTYIYQGNGADFTPGTATEEIWQADNLTNETCASRSNTFTVPSDGNYNIVFHCTSAADEFIAIWDYVIITRPTTPAITFINGANAGLNFVQTDAVPPEDNWLLGQFSLVGDATGATLNSVTVTLGGSYSSSDFGTNPFNLYASETNDFKTASSISSNVAYAGSGSDITFSGLSDAIPSVTRYYWITADVSATASGDDTIHGTIDVAGNLSIFNGTLSGSSVYGKLNAGDDAALPVTLSSFTAETTTQGTLLQWTTESEIENLGFFIERKTVGTDWQEIVSYKNNETLMGQGTVSFPTDYEYVDNLVQQGNAYEYRLADVDYNGIVTYHATREVYVESNPLPSISNNFTVVTYPNPFNPNTTIRYSVPVGAGHDLSVKMQIYDITGKLTTTLVNEEQPSGWYEIQWNGTNQNDNDVPGGVYLSRITVGNDVKTNKLILLK